MVLFHSFLKKQTTNKTTNETKQKQTKPKYCVLKHVLCGKKYKKNKNMFTKKHQDSFYLWDG
jgi:hypothetical protein